MAPPTPHLSPAAYASATQRPFHGGLGHIVLTGDSWLNHQEHILRMRIEAGATLRLLDCGSRTRNHILLSESVHLNKSGLVDTAWCRT